MARTLVIMRHAKSDWGDASLADRDRPLTARGKADAVAMGQELARRGIAPELILCSPAKRARSTLKRVLHNQAEGIPALILPELYGASAGECLRLLFGHGHAAQTVLLVGHNPGLEELASQLCARPLALSAGALVVVSLPIATWDELNTNVHGQFVLALAPRAIPA